MSAKFSEEQVHNYLYSCGMEKLTRDHSVLSDCDYEIEPEDFELWRLLKQRAISKIHKLHSTIRYGSFLASKLKLPTDNTTPMELDLMGYHEDGLFILELKVNRAAERNCFSELFAYSNYISGIFTASGRHDIANVLVANLDAKITRQAFLYDLIIADRNIIVYRPEFETDNLDSLKLELYLPSDDDFKAFSNNLLSHEHMSCAVASFHDLDDWYDSSEDYGALNSVTKEHLGKLSNYAAQLMEAEGLHGFCFIRKPYKEMPRFYRNSLFICAINPFQYADTERLEPIAKQIRKQSGDPHMFYEAPRVAFYGRLTCIAKQAVTDSLEYNKECELETAHWAGIVTSMVEVVMTHNFSFNPTGMLREAYVSYLDSVYSYNEKEPQYAEDVSLLKINEITNWGRAWEFMEACGFS